MGRSCGAPILSSFPARSGGKSIAGNATLSLGISGRDHCDLKPDNIILTKEGRVVLIDFGIAREIYASSDDEELVRSAGTPEYMAPEQVAEAELVDGRVDIYALGIILYELLTGELPFVGGNSFLTAVARLVRPPVNPQEKRPGLCSGLARVVMRCLAKDRRERYRRIEEVAAALYA